MNSLRGCISVLKNKRPLFFRVLGHCELEIQLYTYPIEQDTGKHFSNFRLYRSNDINLIEFSILIRQRPVAEVFSFLFI